MREKATYQTRPKAFEIRRGAVSAEVIAREEITEADEGFSCVEYSIVVAIPVAEKMTSEKVIAAVSADEAKNVRKKRNELLAECDYTMLDDVAITPEKKSEWAAYRQALRDITCQDGFPWDVRYPVRP